MSISDKPGNVSSLQSFLRAIRVTILDREDLYLCVPGQRVIKTDCLLIDQDQINLRVRNATRLNDVLYGRLFRERPLDNCIAFVRSKKTREATVEAKPNRDRVHGNS